MKEELPKGTPEANAEARKRLSLHLTGREKATEKEMLNAVDWWNKKDTAVTHSQPGKPLETKNPVLAGILKTIEKLEKELEGTKKLTKQGRAIIARDILEKLALYQYKTKNEVEDILTGGTRQDREVLKSLQISTHALVQSLIKLLEHHPEYDERDDV